MRAMKLLPMLIGLLFKIGAILLMVLVPLLGVWISSSIAVFANEGLVWAIGAGLLMFPVLPLLWEGWAAYRRKRKQKVGRRYLNVLDRLVLRTLAINVVFLVGLLAMQPKAAFTALSARGDWMLADAQGPAARRARELIFGAADALSWVYEAASDNPYRNEGPTPPPGPTPTPSHRPIATRPGTTGTGTGRKKPTTSRPGSKRAGKPSATQPSTTQPAIADSRAWPQAAELHALASGLSAADERTAEAVGRHIAAKSTDAFEKARAIHDFVADRIAYDAVALAEKRLPPYDPPTVLKRRMAVCAGYATLVVAIARAAGLEAVYLPGHGRQKDGSIDGIGHAWNALRLNGAWYLLDTTWDAGSVDGKTFKKHLSTIYFLTPPEIFGVDHFPDDPRWQLRDKPLSRGDFIRQPFMSGSFYAAGLRLLEPRRPQVTVSHKLTVRLKIPPGTHALVSPQREGTSLKDAKACKQPLAGVFDCRFPSAGRYAVHICVSKKRYGNYRCVGKVLVNSSS